MFGFCDRLSMEHHIGAVFSSAAGVGAAVESVLASVGLDVGTTGGEALLTCGVCWVVPEFLLFEETPALWALGLGELSIVCVEARRGVVEVLPTPVWR